MAISTVSADASNRPHLNGQRAPASVQADGAQANYRLRRSPDPEAKQVPYVMDAKAFPRYGIPS